MIACFSLSIWSFITKKQASLYQVTFGKNGVETVHPIGDLNEYDTRLKACVTQALAKVDCFQLLSLPFGRVPSR